MLKFRKWKQSLQLKILHTKKSQNDQIKGTTHCNSLFGTGLAFTSKLVLQIVKTKLRTISHMSRVLLKQTPLKWVCVATSLLSVGIALCHTRLKNNGNNCIEHHFPELSLLNTVQIIGYVNMHNAFQKHLLYTQILLHATHSVTQVVKMLSQLKVLGHFFFRQHFTFILS